MSPLKIRVLLHHYYSPEPWTETPIAFCDELVRDGLLKKGDTDYHLSDLGRAHVAQILALPLPKQVFVDATGLMIDVGY